jgi:pyrroloquinoline-quinone synthase
VHYGIPLEALALPRAHRAVEGEHRQAAWTMMLDHVAEARRPTVCEALADCLRGWIAYRDAVAQACGVA